MIDATQLSIVWPAFVAGILVTATHVPLGMQVLDRGIVFIDLAIAQVAGCGVILADALGFAPTGVAVQLSALCAALACAALLTWTDRRWPEVQEAIIGVVFVVAASLAILMLAKNPHGSEHLKDLLSGQILWVNAAHLPYVSAVYAVILALWFGLRERLGRMGFYVLFACAVTISVQLVGLFLVFSSLVVPSICTYYSRRARHVKGYAIGIAGYAAGLVLSLLFDLPSGAMIVCAMLLVGMAFALATGARRAAKHRPISKIETRLKAQANTDERG